MKQRVKLAQALVHDPRLLLLDEPTNGLDPAGRDEMLALVRRTGTEFGIAVIVASHLLGEIERVCDFLVAIDAGRLLRAAPLGAFTERTGVLAVEVEEGEAALDRRRSSARGLQAGRRRSDGAPRRSPRTASTTSSATPSPTSGCRSSGWSSGARASRTCSATTSRPRRHRLATGRPPAGRRRAAGRSRSRRRHSASGPGGSIFDLGYQAYDGPAARPPERGPGAVRPDRPRRASGSAAAGGRRSPRSCWSGSRSCRPSWRSGSRRSPRRRARPAARSRKPRRSATRRYHGLVGRS